MENKMFCFQCQETAGCTGCTKFGVCGKSPDLARMQDLLIYTTKGLSEVTTRLREEGKEVSKDVNHLITINLFTTITNANFDDEVFYQRVKAVRFPSTFSAAWARHRQTSPFCPCRPIRPLRQRVS